MKNLQDSKIPNDSAEFLVQKIGGKLRKLLVIRAQKARLLLTELKLISNLLSQQKIESDQLFN